MSRRPVCLYHCSVLIALASAGCSSGATSTTPPPPTVTSVSVTPPSPTIVAGTTVQLSATPEDANGNVVSGQSVSWSSSAPTTATVSSIGLVTGIAIH